jgi:ElaB/YqjD/DUF883 family membrane-anchored ribosome-binding protein
MGSESDEVSRRSVGAEVQRTGTAEYRAGEKPPELIRADIEQTREEMSRTVEAIQDRLDPERLKNEVKQATVGRAREVVDKTSYRIRGLGGRIFDTIRQNPVPAALTVVGLGWLIMEGPPETPTSRTYTGYAGPYEQRTQYPAGYQGRVRYQDRRTIVGVYTPGGEQQHEGRLEGAAHEAREGVEHARERLSDTAEHTRERAQETIGEVQDRVRETAEQTRERAGELIHEGQEQLQEIGERAQHQAQRARSKLAHAIDENPLAVGAAALAVGAVIGLVIPGTPIEDRLMGEPHDEMMERVQEKVSDVSEEVAHRAEEASQEARSKVEEKGKDLQERAAGESPRP